MIFPEEIATASAIESFGSTVRILPLIRMRSAFWACNKIPAPMNKKLTRCMWFLIVPGYGTKVKETLWGRMPSCSGLLTRSVCGRELYHTYLSTIRGGPELPPITLVASTN